jgi:hypothetical protein
VALGKALVSALLEAGAAKVYAAARDVSKVTSSDPRVVALALDTSSPEQIAAAVTELVPGKKIVWHVTDSQIHFVRDKSEWDGTDIVFEIARKGDKTEVRFTHVGLVPAIECYDGCSGAWGFYVNESLRDLIAKGKGQPNPDERRPSRAKSRGEQRAHDSRR